MKTNLAAELILQYTTSILAQNRPPLSIFNPTTDVTTAADHFIPLNSSAVHNYLVSTPSLREHSSCLYQRFTNQLAERLHRMHTYVHLLSMLSVTVFPELYACTENTSSAVYSALPPHSSILLLTN